MRHLLLLSAFVIALGGAAAGQADPFSRQTDQRPLDLVQTAKSGKFDERTLTLTLQEASQPTAIAGRTAGVRAGEVGAAGDGWRDAVLTFDFNGKTLEAKLKISAAVYEGTTVSYDVRLISGQLAECFDNPRMVFEAVEVAKSSAAAIARQS